MPIRVVCPQCGTSGMAPDNLAGKKARCRCCGGPIPIGDRTANAKPTPAARPALPPAPLKPWVARALVWGPVGWLLTGSLWAIAAPWLGMAPEALTLPLNYLPLVVTLAVILGNAVQAVRILGRTGTMTSILPLALVQLGLFTLLFFELAAHVGAQNYVWDEGPSWRDWLGLVLGHLVHVADLFDALESFGISGETMHGHGPLTAACLLLFHLLFGLFFLGLAIEFVEPFTRNLLRQLAGWWVAAFIVFVLAWTVTVEFYRPWRRGDMLAWWIDNFVRVVDFADLLEVADVRLHLLPKSGWEGALTHLCRLFIGVAALSLVSLVWLRLRIREWRGFGVSRDTLEEQVEVYSKAALKPDAEKLLEERAGLPVVPPGPWEKLSAQTTVAIAVAVLVLPLVLALVSRSWSSPAQRFADAGLSGDSTAQQRGLMALRKLGPYAESVVPALSDGSAGLERERQDAVLQTLGVLGPSGRAQLGQWLLGADQNLALRSIVALRSAGAQSAPQLVHGQFALSAPVRTAARKVLEELGPAASTSLLQELTPENAWIFYPWLEKLDRSWTARLTRNRSFGDLCQVKFMLAQVADPGSDGLALHQAASELMRIDRPLALPAVPALDERVRQTPRLEVITTEGPLDGMKTVRLALQKLGPSPLVPVVILRNAIEKLSRPPLPPETCQKIDAGEAGSLTKFMMQPQGKNAVPALEKMLADDDADVLLLSLTALRASGQWAPTDPAPMVALLKKSSVPIKLNAIQVLGRMEKDAAPAVPALTKTLDDKNLELRLAAVQTLGQIGPAAKEAIPALQQMSKDEDKLIRQQALRVLPLIEKKSTRK